MMKLNQLLRSRIFLTVLSCAVKQIISMRATSSLKRS
jgi:hypothetical protein